MTCRLQTHYSRGVTLVEIMIVVGMMVALAIITVPNLFGNKSKRALDGTTQEIVSTLREAKSRAVAGASDVTWGVHFERTGTSFYTIFSGATFTGANGVGYYVLPPGVDYVTSTLNGGTVKEVLFARLDGTTASTSVRIYLSNFPSFSSTISVASSGVITY